MDKFDVFLDNLNELLASQPPKMSGDGAIVGYWMAIHAVRNAAHVAKCAVDGCEHHWIPHVEGFDICTVCCEERQNL